MSKDELYTSCPDDSLGDFSIDILRHQNEQIAIFMNADSTWYLYIDGVPVSLPKIIEQMNKLSDMLYTMAGETDGRL